MNLLEFRNKVAKLLEKEGAEIPSAGMFMGTNGKHEADLVVNYDGEQYHVVMVDANELAQRKEIPDA